MQKTYICSSTDTMAELEFLKDASIASGAFRAVVCNHWALGGAGAIELADSVIEACNQPSTFK